ncbi:MAG: MarR family transcriptional regulator [Bacillus sp. (in: firmicutes)]
MDNQLYDEVLDSLQTFVVKKERKQQLRQKISDTFEQKGILNRQWTITQLHIASLLKENGESNNRFLADKLNLTKAAVTKATKELLDENVIAAVQKAENKKEIYYTLSKEGEMLALVHDELHEKLRMRYIEIFKQFDEHELKAIRRFFKEVTEII